MKKLLLASAIFCIASAAQAVPTLTVIDSVDTTFSGYNGQPVAQTGVLSSGVLGKLGTTGAGTVTFTYLGNESGDTNLFTFGALSLLESDSVGSSISGAVAGAGALSFTFTDSDTGLVVGNLGSNYVVNVAGSGPYDYFLGFNDNGSLDGDFDDFVVGVSFTAAPIPEPETYAMLLAGLGVVGFMARRRRVE